MRSASSAKRGRAERTPAHHAIRQSSRVRDPVVPRDAHRVLGRGAAESARELLRAGLVEPGGLELDGHVRLPTEQGDQGAREELGVEAEAHLEPQQLADVSARARRDDLDEGAAFARLVARGVRTGEPVERGEDFGLRAAGRLEPQLPGPLRGHSGGRARADERDRRRRARAPPRTRARAARDWTRRRTDRTGGAAHDEVSAQASRRGGRHAGPF